jgi:hypothetical protein
MLLKNQCHLRLRFLIKKNYNHRAFLLFETLIVLTLLTFAVVSGWWYSSLTIQRTLIQETKNIMLIFATLQKRAILTHKIHCIDFNEQSQRYTAHDQGSYVRHYMLTSGIQWGFIASAYGPPSAPIKNLLKTHTFPLDHKQARLFFYPNGTITCGSMYFVDKSKRFMTALSCGVGDETTIKIYCYKGHKTWNIIHA